MTIRCREHVPEGFVLYCEVPVVEDCVLYIAISPGGIPHLFVEFDAENGAWIPFLISPMALSWLREHGVYQ